MSFKSIQQAYIQIVSNECTIVTEALASAATKAMASKASTSTASNGLSKAQQISKDVFPVGEDRIVIPFERNLEPNSDVKKHLVANGYKITDYKAGLATKVGEDNRQLRIGKILNRTGASDELFQKFDKDPARQGIKTNEHHIVISRHPYDVAAMSSGQNWESCQTLKQTFTHTNSDGTSRKVSQTRGMHSDMVPGIVASGAHIAYLVKDPKDVDKHFGPLARITLNAFHSENNHSILRPSEEYGERYAGFHDTMKRWSEKNFPTKDAVYYRDEKSYPEGQKTVVDYSPKHDEYWKDEYFSADALRNHPSNEVHVDWANRFARGPRNHVGHAMHLMDNPALSKENSDKVFNVLLSDSSNLHHAATKTKYHDQIESLMQHPKFNSITAVYLASNDNCSADQLHKLLDEHAEKDDYASDRLINNVALNKNSNETHYRKILNSPKLESTSPDIGSNLSDLSPAIGAISEKYHTEDIAQKLIKHPVVMSSVVHHIALKHPHLLSQINAEAVRRAVRQYGMNKSLQNYALRSGNTDLIKAAISGYPVSTGDSSFFDQFESHPDQSIREHATNQKRLFNLAKESMR